MKKSLIILLSALVLLQHGTKLWVIATFEMNREYIAEFLCVNKDAPELGCQGACYLKAQLEKEEQQHPQENPHKRKSLEETMFYQPILQIAEEVSFLPYSAENSWMKIYQIPDNQDFLTGVFRPPILVSPILL